MNPVGAAGNIFSALFDQVPAKRAGNESDIAGTILYLASRAGVSIPCFQNTRDWPSADMCISGIC